MGIIHTVITVFTPNTLIEDPLKGRFWGVEILKLLICNVRYLSKGFLPDV